MMNLIDKASHLRKNVSMNYVLSLIMHNKGIRYYEYIHGECIKVFLKRKRGGSVSTRHVILALLEVEPMNGYDLAQNIKLSVDSLWAATYGQIYPMLHKLEAEGLLTSENQVRGQHMQRVVYSLTPTGRAELERWLQQPIQYLPFRDPFKLWASYIDACPPQAVFRNIAEHIRMHTQRAETLEQVACSIENGTHPLTQMRQEHLPEEKVERLKRARSLVYYELARQARFEVESAKRIWQLATELYPDECAQSIVSDAV